MSRSRSLIAPFLAAAIAISTVGVVGVGAQSPSESPGASAGAGAPSSAPNDSGGVVTITDGEGFVGSAAQGIAAAPDGSIVMVGWRGADPARPDSAMVWRSVDGVAWSSSDLPKSKGMAAVGVAITSAGWVAIGTQPFFGGGLTWTSSDGLKWKLGKTQGDKFEAIIATSTGALIGAGDRGAHGQYTPTLWRSTNLKKWRALKLLGTGSAVDLVQGAAGVTLVIVSSSDVVDGNHVTTSSLVRSADGSTWQTIDLPVPASGPDEIVSAGDLGLAGDLFVQVMNVRPAEGGIGTASIWTSPDGLTWTQADVPPGLSTVVDGPIGNILGTDTQVTSADGLTWTPVSRPGLKPGKSAATLADGRTIVAGYQYGSSGFAVTLQVAPAVGVAAVPSAAASVEPTGSATP